MKKYTFTPQIPKAGRESGIIMASRRHLRVVNISKSIPLFLCPFYGALFLEGWQSLVYCTALEKRRMETYRGSESRAFLQFMNTIREILNSRISRGCSSMEEWMISTHQTRVRFPFTRSIIRDMPIRQYVYCALKFRSIDNPEGEKSNRLDRRNRKQNLGNA